MVVKKIVLNWKLKKVRKENLGKKLPLIEEGIRLGKIVEEQDTNKHTQIRKQRIKFKKLLERASIKPSKEFYLAFLKYELEKEEIKDESGESTGNNLKLANWILKKIEHYGLEKQDKVNIYYYYTLYWLRELSEKPNEEKFKKLRYYMDKIGEINKQSKEYLQIRYFFLLVFISQNLIVMQEACIHEKQEKPQIIDYLDNSEILREIDEVDPIYKEEFLIKLLSSAQKNNVKNFEKIYSWLMDIEKRTGFVATRDYIIKKKERLAIIKTQKYRDIAYFIMVNYRYEKELEKKQGVPKTFIYGVYKKVKEEIGKIKDINTKIRAIEQIIDLAEEKGAYVEIKQIIDEYGSILDKIEGDEFYIEITKKALEEEKENVFIGKTVLLSIAEKIKDEKKRKEIKEMIEGKA